jgi:hypothetical protein
MSREVQLQGMGGVGACCVSVSQRKKAHGTSFESPLLGVMHSDAWHAFFCIFKTKSMSREVQLRGMGGVGACCVSVSQRKKAHGTSFDSPSSRAMCSAARNGCQ